MEEPNSSLFNDLKIHLSADKKAGSANIYDVIKAVFGANHVPVYSKTTLDLNRLYRVEFQKQKNSAQILKILKCEKILSGRIGSQSQIAFLIKLFFGTLD